MNHTRINHTRINISNSIVNYITDILYFPQLNEDIRLRFIWRNLVQEMKREFIDEFFIRKNE